MSRPRHNRDLRDELWGIKHSCTVAPCQNLTSGLSEKYSHIGHTHLADPLSHAEVTELCSAVNTDQDVVGLDVLVHDAAGVQVGHSIQLWVKTRQSVRFQKWERSTNNVIEEPVCFPGVHALLRYEVEQAAKLTILDHQQGSPVLRHHAAVQQSIGLMCDKRKTHKSSMAKMFGWLRPSITSYSASVTKFSRCSRVLFTATGFLKRVFYVSLRGNIDQIKQARLADRW